MFNGITSGVATAAVKDSGTNCTETVADYLDSCGVVDGIDTYQGEATAAGNAAKEQGSLAKTCSEDAELKNSVCKKAYLRGVAAYWTEKKKKLTGEANMANPTFSDAQLRYNEAKVAADEKIMGEAEGCGNSPNNANWCDVNPKQAAKDRIVQMAYGRCHDLCAAELKKTGVSAPVLQKMETLETVMTPYNLNFSPAKLDSICAVATEKNDAGEDVEVNNNKRTKISKLGLVDAVEASKDYELRAVCGAKRFAALKTVIGQIDTELSKVNKELGRLAPRPEEYESTGVEDEEIVE